MERLKIECGDQAYSEDLIPESDIQDDLSDDSSEEILEVEITAEDFSEFVQELKQINGLDTEVVCADEIDTFYDDFEPELENENDFDNSDLFYEENTIDEIQTDVDQDTENLIPITELKPNLESNPLLRLQKLDAFLVEKFLKADKNFLKTRFLSQLIFRQEKSECSNDIREPIDLGDGTFMCNQCMNVYKSKKALNRHIREFHERSQLTKCDKCDYVGASTGALTYHVQIKHLKMFRYECPKCDKFKTQTKPQIVKHLMEEHDVLEENVNDLVKSKLRLRNRAIGGTHQCTHCDYSSPSKFTLKKHIERRHGIVPDTHPEAVCRYCHEEFIDKESNTRHPCPVRMKANETLKAKDVEFVNENGKYVCPSCDQEFLYNIALKNHYMKSHLNGKKLSLSKQPKRRKNIKNENETKNDVFESIIEAEDGSFLCDQCPFIGSKEDLTWHVKQIHKDRINKCDHCLFSTNSKDVLSNHIKRVHDGIASHICHLCSVACWNVKQLGEHLKVEHLEKTRHFFCTQPACEFWSRQRNRLDNHVQRVHLKQKNFLCDKCEFRAFIQPELDAHIREKHLKIFRFNCHLCHRDGIRMGFATRKRLYRHMAFAHNVDPASEDNEVNRELILNPPSLEISQLADQIGGSLGNGGGVLNAAVAAAAGEVKKSKRGRRKGAKNRLKLDPDTGQLVRTLMKRPRKQQTSLHNGGLASSLDLKKNSKNSNNCKSLPRTNNAAILPTTMVTAVASAASAASVAHMNSTASLVAAHAAAASAASVDENNAVAAAAILLNEHNASSLWWPPTFPGV